MALILALRRFLRGFLRGRLDLGLVLSLSLFLASCLGRLLLTLGHPLLRLQLLRFGCGATLLRKCLGSGRPLNVCASPWRLWCVWGRSSALLECRRRTGTALLLLRDVSFPRCSLPYLRRRCERSLRSLSLIVLLHYGVARLIAVVLALQHLLLLDDRISIARILPLV